MNDGVTGFYHQNIEGISGSTEFQNQIENIQLYDENAGATGCTGAFNCAKVYIEQSHLVQAIIGTDPFIPNPFPNNLSDAIDTFKEVANYPPIPIDEFKDEIDQFVNGLAVRNMSYVILIVGIVIIVFILTLYFSQVIGLIPMIFLIIFFVFAIYFIFISYKNNVSLYIDRNTNIIKDTTDDFQDDLVDAIKRTPNAATQALCVYTGNDLCEK